MTTHPISLASGLALPPYLKVRETADHLRVHHLTIREWIKSGYLPHVRLGRCVRIGRDDLLRWLEQRRKAGA
jgi:excisionase family DNA binding protein